MPFFRPMRPVDSFPLETKMTPATLACPGVWTTKCCRHGVWTFAGADFKRRATKWRCPTGECQPASPPAREYVGQGFAPASADPAR